MNNPRNTFGQDVDGPYPYPYCQPNERGEPPPPLRGSFSPSSYDAGLPCWPTWSREYHAVLDKSDPATAICLAARKGDLQFLPEQPQAKLLLLDENGDSGITHAVYSGNMLSLEFLSSMPLCVHTLLNLPSKEGNYPLWVAVIKNRVECAERLL